MKVSMDGRGRAKDNIWIERFWKTIKYEYTYLLLEEMELRSIAELKDSLITRTIIDDIKESIAKYRVNSIYDWQYN